MEAQTKTRVLNLTPHDVNIVGEDGEILVTIPRSGVVARVSMTREPAGTLAVEGVQVPLVRPGYGEVEGLPERPEPGTMYLVSVIVAQALQDRSEWKGRLLVPDTGPGSVVRDEEGRIIGVRYLQLW